MTYMSGPTNIIGNIIHEFKIEKVILPKMEFNLQ